MSFEEFNVSKENQWERMLWLSHDVSSGRVQKGFIPDQQSYKKNNTVVWLSIYL